MLPLRVHWLFLLLRIAREQPAHVGNATHQTVSGCGSHQHTQQQVQTFLALIPTTSFSAYLSLLLRP
jgi:hypothetical protein